MAEHDGSRSDKDVDDAASETVMTPNPYRSPKGEGVVQSDSGKKRLGVLDWVLAFFLGILAAMFVFPTTCMGGLIWFGSVPEAILPVSCLFAVVAAFYVGWLVLRARSNRPLDDDFE